MSASWCNWAGNVVAHPAEEQYVASAEGVAAAVGRAAARGLAVRVAGSGHSFTPLVATDGLLLHVDGLSGIVGVDSDRRRVRVLAGTPLHVLNPALQELGLALPNLGDIDRQTISGAIATGTHGSGMRLQGIAAAVCGLTLVLADGSVLTCSVDVEPDVFAAARVGLGALGVVTEVELQCVPAFRLHAKESAARLSELLPTLQAEADAHDHVDVLWFPHTDRVLVKRNDRVGRGEGPPALSRWRTRLEDDLLANRVFEVANRLGAARPTIVPGLNRLAARGLGTREFADDSWKVFCSSREVRFVESEYAVPRGPSRPCSASSGRGSTGPGRPCPFPSRCASSGPTTPGCRRRTSGTTPTWRSTSTTGWTRSTSSRRSSPSWRSTRAGRTGARCTHSVPTG